jgi:hypothetical protein
LPSCGTGGVPQLTNHPFVAAEAGDVPAELIALTRYWFRESPCGLLVKPVMVQTFDTFVAHVAELHEDPLLVEISKE